MAKKKKAAKKKTVAKKDRGIAVLQSRVNQLEGRLAGCREGKEESQEKLKDAVEERNELAVQVTVAKEDIKFLGERARKDRKRKRKDARRERDLRMINRGLRQAVKAFSRGR